MFMPPENQPRVKAMFLRPDQFQCSICFRIARKGWSDEECQAEARANFGNDVDIIDENIVCDDCYNLYMLALQLEAASKRRQLC
jgi:hypothetical protein